MIELDLQKQWHRPSGTVSLDMQMQVQQGTLLSLFGQSGAGKTTLLRMLAGLTRPDSGMIRVGDTVWFDHARKIDLAPQRRSVGFVFQDYALFPNLSVADNVAYALNKKNAAQLPRLLALTGLSDLRGQLPQRLSGGQKQRVALARALARVISCETRLLLLDEALSALDSELRAQLQDALLHIHREFGLTTLLVSHDVGEVFKLSGQVCLLEQGRVSRTGTPASVFLQQPLQGKLHLQAQVLAIRKEDVVFVLSLLVGADIVEIIASDDEVAGLHIGDRIAISAKAFSPLIFKTSTTSPGAFQS
ncbi:MAG: ATP-binding cassette domain-containing protein [Burkholderiales bacterium]|nr:ATP-binding cassette domain-containing protein [Burkholderiales bacterium]